jgi:hypothetical protein
MFERVEGLQLQQRKYFKSSFLGKIKSGAAQ